MMTAEKPKAKTKNLSVSLPEDLLGRIDDLVGHYGFRSRSHVITELLKESIDKYSEESNET